MGVYAGKGADADKSRLKVADLLQLLLKGLIAVPQRLNIGKKLKPFGGEHYPVVVPLQKDHTPILLQIGHHAAYVGLGVMELPGGGGEAAVFHTVQKGQIFLQVGVSHGGSSFSGVNLPKGGKSVESHSVYHRYPLFARKSRIFCAGRGRAAGRKRWKKH